MRRPSLDDGREGKSPNGFGSWDLTVQLFRTASPEPRGAAQTRAEVLHDLAIVRTPEVFAYFLFLFRSMSGCVSAGKFMFPKNVFDALANRILSHEGEQSLWMLTPNCNFQF